MVGLFGPSETDLERLRSTVQTLGTTSVPGLAAALSWRERKAEKLLAHELGRPNTPIVYEPGHRVVRWGRPPPGPPSPPVVERPPAVRTPSPPVHVVRADRPSNPAPLGRALTALCTSCHVPLIPTGSSSLAVCPQCGRLANPRAPAAASAPATPTPALPRSDAPPPPAPAREPDPTAMADRRSQELFAAYVTSRPIPCPRCRTPLRHRGVSEYSCPSCGQSVRFATPTLAPVAAP